MRFRDVPVETLHSEQEAIDSHLRSILDDDGLTRKGKRHGDRKLRAALERIAVDIQTYYSTSVTEFAR